MPFSSIQIAAGVNTVATPTLNAAGVSQSNLIRFRQGLPEKMGGWQRFVSVAMGSITRSLHAWEDLSGNSWLGVGSLSSLKVITNGAITDITPQSLTTNPALNLSTTVGSQIVTIIDTGVSNLSLYDAVYFNTPITVGGILLAGIFALNSQGSGTTYTINSGQIATSTVNNAGAVPALTTAANSYSVSVAFANHGLSVGGGFNFPIAAIIGGITISGTYPVASVTDANTFVISAASQALSSATVSMNGGAAQYMYYITSGPSSSVSFGAMGPIGQYAIGQGFLFTTTTSTQTGTPISATDWTLDNWGQVLMANPAGGPIFYWQPYAGFSQAIPIGTAPAQNNGIFVSMPNQILVAYGSAKTLISGNLDSTIDPLIVRWSDENDFTQWQTSFLTLAGSFHLGTGSKVVGAAQGAHSAFVLTDVDIYSMSFLGYPLVFGFNQIGTGCGLVGPHAVVTLRGVVYWMSKSNFYYTSGAASVNSIPCSVWDNVFQDLNTTYSNKAVAGANGDFNEIFFYYTSISGGGTENDKYVKLNVVDRTWDYGSLPRSAWQDRSVLGPAIGADPTTQYLQQHETGYSDDGAAMDSYFETGYFAYGNGEDFCVIDHFEPDMKWATASSTTSASVLVTLTAVDYPSGGSAMVSGPLTMTSTTQYLTPRVRGRQAKWKIETNDTTSWWRLGAIRYRYNVGGRR